MKRKGKNIDQYNAKRHEMKVIQAFNLDFICQNTSDVEIQKRGIQQIKREIMNGEDRTQNFWVWNNRGPMGDAKQGVQKEMIR